VGRAKVPGLLEDYAYLADGLLELWQATFETRWLDECRRLASDALGLFADTSSAGFFTTGADHERLIVRRKEIVESATPSPGAVLALVLQRLAVLLGRRDQAAAALSALRLARPFMERAPQACATWLQALDFSLSTPTEVALAGDLASPEGHALVAAVTRRYLPNRVLAGGPGPAADIPLLRDRQPLDGRPAAYVCRNSVCELPTADPGELARLLSRP
jgi:hypothetical protein